MSKKSEPRKAKVKIKWEPSTTTITVPAGVTDVDDWLADLLPEQLADHMTTPDDPEPADWEFEEWC